MSRTIFKENKSIRIEEDEIAKTYSKFYIIDKKTNKEIYGPYDMVENDDYDCFRAYDEANDDLYLFTENAKIITINPIENPIKVQNIVDQLAADIDLVKTWKFPFKLPDDFFANKKIQKAIFQAHDMIYTEEVVKARLNNDKKTVAGLSVMHDLEHEELLRTFSRKNIEKARHDVREKQKA